MIIKDEALKKQVEKARCYELEYRLDNFLDDDAEGLTEKEAVIRELEWVIEDFEEDAGHCLHDELLEARRLLKESRYGKRMRIDVNLRDGTMKPRYTAYQIQQAKDLVNEYQRSKRLLERLKKQA